MLFEERRYVLVIERWREGEDTIESCGCGCERSREITETISFVFG